MKTVSRSSPDLWSRLCDRSRKVLLTFPVAALEGGTPRRTKRRSGAHLLRLLGSKSPANQKLYNATRRPTVACGTAIGDSPYAPWTEDSDLYVTGETQKAGVQEVLKLLMFLRQNGENSR
jgi:hypothetical protein